MLYFWRTIFTMAGYYQKAKEFETETEWAWFLYGTCRSDWWIKKK